MRKSVELADIVFYLNPHLFECFNIFQMMFMENIKKISGGQPRHGPFHYLTPEDWKPANNLLQPGWLFFGICFLRIICAALTDDSQVLAIFLLLVSIHCYFFILHLFEHLTKCHLSICSALCRRPEQKQFVSKTMEMFWGYLQCMRKAHPRRVSYLFRKTKMSIKQSFVYLPVKLVRLQHVTPQWPHHWWKTALS